MADDVDFNTLILIYENLEPVLSNLDFEVALGFIGVVIRPSV